MKKNKQVIIYQSKTGAIELSADAQRKTIWATQAQMAGIFGVNSQAITKHLKNVYDERELSKKATCSKMEQVQKEGGRIIRRYMFVYNLDAIISVGYRINSKMGTRFRQWATKILRQHIVEGYTINKKRISRNYDVFLRAVQDVKKLLPNCTTYQASDALELVKLFGDTWLSLDAYDKVLFPKGRGTKKQVNISVEELKSALRGLCVTLVGKKEATELFGQERGGDGIGGIVGNVFQSFDHKKLYPTVEEQAVHLLYFIVKNHPFIDGNKRSAAFAFVWFLRRANLLDSSRMTPEALTTLTLLVAESHPKEKDRMIGLVLMLLNKRRE